MQKSLFAKFFEANIGELSIKHIVKGLPARYTRNLRDADNDYDNFLENVYYPTRDGEIFKKFNLEEMANKIFNQIWLNGYDGYSLCALDLIILTNLEARKTFNREDAKLILETDDLLGIPQRIHPVIADMLFIELIITMENISLAGTNESLTNWQESHDINENPLIKFDE